MTTSGPGRARIEFCALFLLLGSILLGSAVIASAAPSRHARSSKAVAIAARTRPRHLMNAARISARADRVLVADAKSLKRCLRVHHTHPKSCAAARRSLQRAGSRFAKAQRRLARIARSTGRAGAVAGATRASRTPNPRLAPHLTVSGQSLTWSRVDGIDTYVLMRKVPGQATLYSVVYGNSITPPPVPGATVSYSVRTTASESTWSAEQSITYSPANEQIKAPNAQAAPAIAVSGQTLTWNAIAGSSTYVLVRTVPGQPAQYSEVSGTSTTPPAVPGTTVHYSVRTAVDGSAWAPEVSISYPTTPTAPAPTPAPVQESPAATPLTFQPGLNSGSNQVYDVQGASKLGAKVVRLAFGIGDSAQSMEAIIGDYANVGIQVVPLACFDGRIPTSSQAANLGAWAKAFGPGGTYWSTHSGGSYAVQSIEYGNETSYSYQYSDDSPSGYASRAQAYALSFAEAATAVRSANSGVGLLTQGDAGNAGAAWIRNMFKAVPNLGSLVAGWTIHPYGTSGVERVKNLVSELAAQGAPTTIPIDVTEWGVSTDNGRCLAENFGWNDCMSYQEAGEVLTRTVSEMRTVADGRLGLFMLYQVRDQEPTGASTAMEGYFGALQHLLQPKGAYTTAVEALMAD